MKVLDLFCGAGGAAWGYHLAGFEVVGVDIKAQPNYPFEFIQADAMEFPLDSFDLIHASPPCQGYSSYVSSNNSKYARSKGKSEPRLVQQLIQKFQGKVYVVENVPGAREEMINPIELCGVMFGLPIRRHRLFDSNLSLYAPEHPKCLGIAKEYAERKGWEYRDMSVSGKGRHAGTSDRWREIMDIPYYMSQQELRESIPPAYTKWIGEQILSG